MKKVPSDICDKVRQKVGSSVQSIHLLDTEGLRLTQTHVETSEDWLDCSDAQTDICFRWAQLSADNRPG